MRRAEIEERLGRAVRGEVPGGGAPVRTLTPAAVLVPLVDRPGGFTVLLTRRTEHLANHGGQISFPGGRAEDVDGDLASTALRETAEEIGLHSGALQLIGALDDCETITGFIVTPVVAIVSPPFVLRLDPFEVAYVFEVPLSFVLDRENHRSEISSHHELHHETGHRTGRKIDRVSYALPYGDQHIWGATACILMNLYRVLSAP